MQLPLVQAALICVFASAVSSKASILNGLHLSHDPPPLNLASHVDSGSFRLHSNNKRQLSCGVRGSFLAKYSPTAGIPVVVVASPSDCLSQCPTLVPTYKSISLARDKDSGSLACSCWPNSPSESIFTPFTVDADFQEAFFDYGCDPAAADASISSNVVLPGTLTALVGCHLRGHFPDDSGSLPVFPPFFDPSGCLSICNSGSSHAFSMSDLDGQDCCACWSGLLVDPSSTFVLSNDPNDRLYWSTQCQVSSSDYTIADGPMETLFTAS